MTNLYKEVWRHYKYAKRNPLASSSKIKTPWGVKCLIHECGYEFYKGSPMTKKELETNKCMHMINKSNTEESLTNNT